MQTVGKIVFFKLGRQSIVCCSRRIWLVNHVYLFPAIKTLDQVNDGRYILDTKLCEREVPVVERSIVERSVLETVASSTETAHPNIKPQVDNFKKVVLVTRKREI